MVELAVERNSRNKHYYLIYISLIKKHEIMYINTIYFRETDIIYSDEKEFSEKCND